MINLYQYEYAGRVKLLDIDDKTWLGEACDMTSREDQSEDDKYEDSLTIKTDDGRYVDFFESEIKEIEILKKHD